MDRALTHVPAIQGAIRDNYGATQYPSIAGVELNNASQLSYPNAFNNVTTERFQMAANTVWKMSVLDDSEFLTTQILPKRKVDQLAMTFEVTRMLPTLMEPNPEWGQAKLVSLSRLQRVARLDRWGLQLEIEINMAMDPYGQKAFAIYIETIQRAFEDTLAVQVLVELLNAHHDEQRKVLRDNRFRGRPPFAAMQSEILYYQALQKLKRPLEKIDAKISEDMAAIGGRFNTLILPSQARAYVKTNKDEYLTYSKAGPAGPALSRSDIHANETKSDYPGFGSSLQIYSVKRSHAMNELTGGRDIMTSNSTIGEFYIIQSCREWDDEKWHSQDEAVKIYDEERGNYKTISLNDVVKHSRVFDASGNLVRVDSLPYQGPAEYPVNGTGVDDIFSDDDGTPVHVFGQIRPKYLTATDRVKWARGFLKRKVVDEQKLNDLFSKLQSLSGGKGPVNYAGNTDVDTLLKGDLISNLTRCFQTSPYLNANAAPRGYNTKEAAFLFNVILPHYLPSFGTNGASTAEVQGSALKQLYDQLFSGPVANATDDQVYAAATLYALRQVATDKAKYAAQTQAAIVPDNVANLAREFKGDRALFEKVRAKALEVYNKNKSVASSDKVQPEAKYFSPEQAKAVYDEWKTNNTPPASIPGNPDFPGVPATFDDLEKYFGDNASPSVFQHHHLASAYHHTTPYITSLVQSHAHSLQRAEEQRYTEDAEAHEFIAAKGSSFLKSLLDTAQQIGSPLHPSRYGSTGAASPELAALTSDEFTTLMGEIHQIATPAERVIAMLFNTSRVHMSTLNRFAQCGLPLPFAGLLLRPYITHTTAHMIACWRGEELGFTAVAMPRWTTGMDPGAQSQKGHFTMYSKAMVTAPHLVYLVPNAMIVGYIGGNSCDWIDPEKERMYASSSTESLYATLIPITSCEHDIKPLISLSGQTSHLQVFNELGCQEEPPFPQATRFVKTFGTYEMYQNSGMAEENGANPRNMICVEGQYLKRGPTGSFDQMVSGQSGLGDTNGPNAKQVRLGGLTSYDDGKRSALNNYQ